MKQRQRQGIGRARRDLGFSSSRDGERPDGTIEVSEAECCQAEMVRIAVILWPQLGSSLQVGEAGPQIGGPQLPQSTPEIGFGQSWGRQSIWRVLACSLPHVDGPVIIRVLKSFQPVPL